jgi:polyhydroxyalkanoate synthesis regulator phasin
MSENNINEGLKKVMYTGLGLAAVSVDMIAKAVELLAAKGEEAYEKGKVLNEELKRKRAVARANVQDIAEALDQMSKDEVETVRAKLADIEQAMADAGKEAKINAASIADRLEELSRDEIGAIKAKLEEIKKNWTDDGDKGAEG